MLRSFQGFPSVAIQNVFKMAIRSMFRYIGFQDRETLGTNYDPSLSFV